MPLNQMEQSLIYQMTEMMINGPKYNMPLKWKTFPHYFLPQWIQMAPSKKKTLIHLMIEMILSILNVSFTTMQPVELPQVMMIQPIVRIQTHWHTHSYESALKYAYTFDHQQALSHMDLVHYLSQIQFPVDQ